MSSDGNEDNLNEVEETTKEDYQIAICQDGRFAVTFDTANLWIRILKNTFEIDKKTDQQNSNESVEIDGQQNSNKSAEIDKGTATIAHFKINPDFIIDRFYDTDDEPTRMNLNPFKWSLDISNVQKHQYHQYINKTVEYFILVAVSRIDVNEDMKGTHKNNDENDECDQCKSCKKGPLKMVEFNSTPADEIKLNMQPELKKGTAIYRLKLDGNYALVKDAAVACHYTDSVSGICRFVEDIDENLDEEDLDSFKNKDTADNKSKDNDEQDKQLRRFIIINFHGIYNFKFKGGFKSFNLNKRFKYPKSIWHELNSGTSTNLMDKLLTCLYDQYFLIERYQNDVQILEVYKLAEMKLETQAEEKDKHTKKYHKNTFSISKHKLQLCFTRGFNTVKLYLMENGLKIASKTFHQLENIYLLEFIDNDEKLLIIGKDKNLENKVKFVIWDIYNTEAHEQVMLEEYFMIGDNLGTRFARTSGNLLQVDDNGNVISVLRKVEYKLKQIQQKEAENDLIEYSDKKRGKKPDRKQDEKHIIHFDTDKNFEQIVDEKEPWVMDDYERNSYCLYNDDKETLQLIVGRSTVQIWHQIHSGPDDKSKKEEDLPNKGEPFLEYIWANGIPVDQEREETRLRVEEFKYGKSDGINDKLFDFNLKVYWYERIPNKKNEEEEKNNETEELVETKKEMKNGMERKEKVIQRKDIIEKFNAVRHACKALEHLNKRAKYKKLENYHVKIHRYEEMVAYISHILWRFIKYKPKEYKLLDFRHSVMKNLILGDCDQLIKFILFGDKKDGKNKKKLHTPRNILWNKSRNFVEDDDFKPFENEDDISNERDKIIPTNDLELAIYHCKGRELKNTVIVAYLLEYYSQHAMEDPGWMTTVSKAIPLLFKYHYDDYAKKLFRKECFADQDHSSMQDPDQIIQKEHPARHSRNTNFTAFKPTIVKLQSDKIKWYIRILDKYKSFKNKIVEFYENFDNHFGKPPLALRVVPLPNFTTSSKKNRKSNKSNEIKTILKLFWFIFVPLWYKFKPQWYKWWYKTRRYDENKLSPFSRMIFYENHDDIYDNPAIQATIDFRWKKSIDSFFTLFFRFLIFALCFVLISWAYLDNSSNINENIPAALFIIIVFYYMALYLFTTELFQLYYRGPRKYFQNIYNYFDIISIVLPVITMSLMLKYFKLSDGFGSVDPENSKLTSWIAFSIFILWIQFVLCFRLFSKISIYIGYILIIFDLVFPFFLFILVVIIAFASTMFILLRNPKDFSTRENTYSGVATNNSTNETFNIELKSDFNATDQYDNPFSHFPTAIQAVYFWINGGDLVQRDYFDSWAVEIITLIASIFLVIILQNMLIGFMTGSFKEAETKGRLALLKYKANKIADYEALHHFRLRKKPDPKYIYYIGRSKNFEEWYNNIKKDGQNVIYKGLKKKSTEHTFKEADYDSVSIWKYDDKDKFEDIKEKIREAKKMKKNLDAYIEELNKKLNN